VLYSSGANRSSRMGRPDPGVPCRGVQLGLQVAAQDVVVPPTEQAAAQSRVADGDPRATRHVDEHQALDRDVDALQRRPQPQPLGRVDAGTEEIDHVAAAPGSGRGLHHGRGPAELTQPQGGRQPGDAGSDDKNPHGRAPSPAARDAGPAAAPHGVDCHTSQPGAGFPR
jgi:hypothetical protein